MRPTPILFLSDSPDLHTGLARISSNLAQIAASMPEFRVGFLGRGGVGSCKLPFAQYSFPESRQWGEQELPWVWEDFVGRNGSGIIMTVWDATRLYWLANPHMLVDGPLRRLLVSDRISRWGYFPVDAHGVGGGMGGIVRDTLARYDRVLAYTAFGADVMKRVLSQQIDYIPHGINADKFKPRGREAGRAAMRVSEDCTVVGCVMTNQERKHWGLAFEVFNRLKHSRAAVGAAAGAGRQYKFWISVDVLERYWSIPALVEDFGLQDDCLVTEGSGMTDVEMAHWYSGCDLTILPSRGEGFGYPIAESLACGVPVVHGGYAGGVELIPRQEWLVEPEIMELAGMYNLYRPVFIAEDWVAAVQMALDELDKQDREAVELECVRAVEHLKWDNLRPVWQKWFRDGVVVPRTLLL